jgi:hypothetical protein
VSINIKLAKKFYFDDELPQMCSSCNDEYCGSYHGFIKINGQKIYLDLCRKCKKRLQESLQ